VPSTTCGRATWVPCEVEACTTSDSVGARPGPLLNDETWLGPCLSLYQAVLSCPTIPSAASAVVWRGTQSNDQRSSGRPERACEWMADERTTSLRAVERASRSGSMRRSTRWWPRPVLLRGKRKSNEKGTVFPRPTADPRPRRAPLAAKSLRPVVVARLKTPIFGVP
jgi:hypothetical protein